MTTITIEALLKAATEQLNASGSPSPSLDASVLLCASLGKPRSYLLTWPEQLVEPTVIDTFNSFLARRLSGEPVAYILGYREFWSLNLAVSPTTLIPRADTERLIEVALEKSSNISGPILDLGTGTGAIALALASELPQVEVIGVDVMPQAQQLAALNAERLGIRNCCFLHGSWFDPIEHGTKFALIVSNPPYIDGEDPHLSQGDVRFEPKSALVAADYGMADICHIARAAREYLQPQGWLIFEHGYDQGIQVRQELAALGYLQVETVQDYAGHDRVTLGQYYPLC
jgi:release factor glutamine methyltransferase